MDAHERQPIPPVVRDLLDQPYHFNFFVAVRIAESLIHTRSQVGYGSAPQEEPVRFEATTNLAFPGSDLVGANWNGDPLEPLRLAVTFLGLHGVSSPLPAYFQQISAGDSPSALAMREFLTLFNQRMLALFYRAWKRNRLADEWHGAEHETAMHLFAALAGLRMSRRTGYATSGPQLLRDSALLSSAVRSAAGLERVLTDYFCLPVRVRQRVPYFRDNHAQAQLGNPALRLGSSIVIGTSVKSVTQSFRITFEEVSAAQAQHLLPVGNGGHALQEVVRGYLRDPHYYHLRLRVLTHDIQPVALGTNTAPLGWLSWLGKVAQPKETVELGWREA